ncbi:MAG: baseplate J/gp47 family protein [Burkholderiales bacterium]|nr:baseplate J/gp47 family protein [Burkholderiales bacterium]
MAEDTTVYDLTGFPRPEAIQEISAEAIVSEMSTDLVARFPAMNGVVGLESEPSTKNIEVNAFRETLVRARINDAVRANLLAYATGADLDHLAVFYDVIRMTGEADDRLRLRTILAIQGRSPGGTEPRYRKIALDSSLRVADAKVYTVGTSPIVRFAIFAADNNGVADAPLLEIVRAAVNAPDKRMVSDTLLVQAAVFATVNIVADIWLLPETPDTLITPVTPTVANPFGDSPLASSLRLSWQTEGGLGFDLNREWITARLMVPGIQRAVPTSPAVNQIADPQNAIAIGTITLVNRGRAF